MGVLRNVKNKMATLFQGSGAALTESCGVGDRPGSMGLLQQIGLLLHKNYLLRRRHPGILLLEVVWPILIVAIVALIRAGIPPAEHSSCHYQDRAMPSAGLVPFMQTFVCNLDNECHSPTSRQTAIQNAASVSAMVQKITPYLGNEGTLQLLDNVDDGVEIINTFNSIVQDDGLMRQLDNATSLAQYFRDPDMLKRLMVTDYNFTQAAVDALMSSQANLTAVMDLSGFPDLKGVACDPKQLSQFLIFPKGTNVTEVTQALCGVNESKIPEMTDFFQRHVNVAEIVRLLGLFESLKERLNIPYTLAQGLTDVADMLDLVLSIGDLTQAVSELAGISGLPDIIRNIPAWIDKIEASGSSVAPLGNLIDAMDPIVAQFVPNNSMWLSLKDGLQLGSYITDMVAGNTTAGNVSSQQFMQVAGAFITDMERAFNDFSPEVRQTLDALAKLNWPQLWGMVSSIGDNDEMLWKTGLDSVQTALEQTPIWSDLARFLPVVQDLAHSGNLILDQLIKLEQGVSDLKAGGGELKLAMDTLLDTGPNVTLAVLKAFTHPNVLAKLLVDTSFADVCTDVVTSIRDDVGAATAQELDSLLCSGGVSSAVGSLMQDLGVSNISMALNKTISQLVSVMQGGAAEGEVSLMALYQEANVMARHLQQVVSLNASSWADLFSLTDTLTQLIETHSRQWEPVQDMLNENYVGSSVLSFVTAAGQMMDNSSSAQWMQENVGPYIHMADTMVKTVYNEMQLMMNTYSAQSPLGQMVYYVTNYAPDILTAIFDKANTAMVYTLASANDPLSEFCVGHMMRKMGIHIMEAVRVEEVICITNWTKVVDNVMQTQTIYTHLVEEMVKSVADMSNTTITNTYSLEGDWRELTYYVSRVIDMVSPIHNSIEGNAVGLSPALQLPTALTQGPWTLLDYVNLTQIAPAMEVVMTNVKSWDNDSLKIFIDIVVMRMELFEKQVTLEGNTSTSALEWRTLKHYVKIVDDYSTVILYSSAQVVPTSIPEMLKFAPDDLKHMVSLAAGAYLELIDALKNIVHHPDKLISKIALEGLNAPDCDNVTITGLLMLEPSSQFGQLETQACTANWTDIAIRMAAIQQNEPIGIAMGDLIMQLTDLDKAIPELDPVVNWTQVLNKVVQAVNMTVWQLEHMEDSFAHFDLQPFNMTAINAKWADFYKDMEQLQNIDYDSLMTAVAELQGMLQKEIVQEIPDNNELMQMLNANMFLSQQVMHFANIQLKYFNSTSVVNLMDWLGPGVELGKLFKVLERSPEINQIGVNTLIRVITDPSKLVIVFDPSALCWNMTLFSEMFAVDNSIIDTTLLQKTVCDLDIDPEVLLEDLKQHWAGFEELVQAFEELMNPNSTLNVTLGQYAEEQLGFTELLTSVLTKPPVFVIMDNERWTNTSLYEGPWIQLGHELEGLYEKYQDPSTIVSSLVGYLKDVIADPAVKPILGYMDAVLDMVQRYAGGFDALPQSFTGYQNLEKMYSLLEQLPELIEMVASTVLTHPEKLNNWGVAMASWDTFCMSDPTTLMTAPPGVDLDVREVFGRLCAINFTELVIELNAYQGLDRLANAGNITVNITELADKLTSVLNNLEQTFNETSLTMNTDLRFLNSTVWNTVIERLETEMNATLERYMWPDFLLRALNMSSTLFPEFGGFEGTIKQAMALMDIILDQVVRSMDGGSLTQMFSEYPMVKSVVSLMDKLPEIYETLAYTSIFTPQKVVEQTGALTSFEGFCNTSIHMMLTAPPQSSYDLDGWQRTICAVNLTVLMEELAAYQGTLDVAKVLLPNSTYVVNMTSLTEKLNKVTDEFNRLFAGEATTFNIDAYFNVTAWDGVMKHLQRWMEDATQTWSSQAFYQQLVSAQVLSSLQAIPEVKAALGYVSPILDMVQRYAGGFDTLPQSFTGYTNLEKMYSLLEQLPELMEMVASTVLTHPEKLNNWGGAMASWDTFCLSDPTTLMTAPPGGDLDVTEVFGRLCAINFTELVIELNAYQGLDRLANAGNATVNVAELADKLTSVLNNLEQTFNESTLTMNTDLRFLNSSVWNTVIGRLETEMNATLDRYLWPDFLLRALSMSSTLLPEFGGFEGTIKQVMALMDIILDQVVRSMDGGNLTQMFSEYPMVKSVVSLMDKLPEIYETLAYTGLFTPQKLMEQAGALASIEGFCNTSIHLMLTAPPQSSYDLDGWQRTICAVNLTVLMEELAAYQGTLDVGKILLPNSTYVVNMTSLTEKLNKVTDEFNRLFTGEATTFNIDAYFNVTAWNGVMKHLQTWMQDATQTWSTPSFYKQLVSAQVLSGLQAIPEVNTALGYSSAILDMVETSLKSSLTSLPEAFADYPNMKTLVSLLEDVPDIFEMFAFTTLQHQEQLARWSPAMASWDTFCSYDPNTLVTAPSGSRLTVVDVFTRLCSLNVTELMAELAQYQGMDKLNAVILGTQTEPVNVTAIAERMSGLIDSMTALATNPMDSVNLRVFNETLWEQVFERLGENLNSTQQQFMSPEFLMDFYQKLFGGYAELNDTANTLNKVWAVTDVILDQMLTSFQGGNLQEMFAQYPTIKSAAGLLDSLPELYETVMYTALYAPDKVVTRLSAFDTWETFCGTDMNTLFTVPEAVDFDLNAWRSQLCSLNLTVLMAELAQYQGTQAITDIFSPNSTVHVNMTSLIQKIETVVNKLTAMGEGGAPWTTFDARFLNSSLWERANSNLEIWAANSTTLFYMRTDKFMELYNTLQQQYPELMQEMDFMGPVYSLLGLVADKMIQYENMTSLTLDQLFVNAPEMQKLVRLVEEPGVVEVLFQSVNSEKFEPLLVSSNVTAVFTMLCTPSASLDQYLTVPSGVQIDLAAVKVHLCDLDLDHLEKEAMNFFDIDSITAALNGSLPVDYAAVIPKVNRMSALLVKWIEQPPTFTLPAAWQNESYWLGILENYAMPRQDPAAILSELENVAKSLEPLLKDNDAVRQMLLVAQTVLRLVNENVAGLRGQNLTLENVVQRVPVLREVFTALGVQGDVLTAMLKAPVQSGQTLVEAVLSSGTAAQQTICNITRLQELLELPASFNDTALYQAVCLNNATRAVDSLVANLDLQGLIDGLSSPATTANLSLVFQQSEKLQKNIEDLIQHPPSFNASSLISTLERSFNTSDLWQMASLFSAFNIYGLTEMFPEQEVRMMAGAMKSASVVTEMLDDLLKRLVIEKGSVDLASLFASSPSFVRLMDAVLTTQPDLFTALSSAQLKPSKASELMTQNPDNLLKALCSPIELEQYVLLPDGVNVTEVVNVLCTLNFTALQEELSDNFMVEALTKKFASAMNSSEPLDLQKYITANMNLVERITALAGVTNVTFDGNSIADAFNINMTRLTEAMESVGSMLEKDYPSLIALSLDSTLATLANTSEGQQIVFALKVVEVYLHSFNNVLKDISSRPISLASIVNNTEVGAIVMPFLVKPYTLQDLLDLELMPAQLSALLGRADLTDALCGPLLFTAFEAPGNESAALRHLQTSVCSANATVMMWQAIMGQADGYQLYQQIELLSKEMEAGSASVNISAISGETQDLITMVTKIVEEYQNGNRSAEDLLDWRSFEAIFNRFSSSAVDRLLNMSQKWSTELSASLTGSLQSLLPNLPDDPYSSMARTVNSMNIFMDIINDRLQDIITEGVSLQSLLNHSDSLVHLMEAFLDVTRLTPQAWLDNQFNVSKVVEVAANETMLKRLCTESSLASYLADGASVATVTSAMQTALCSITTELPDAFTQFVDFKAIETQLAATWNMSLAVVPQYKQYTDNINRLNTLITQLATHAPSLDPSLSTQFNFTNVLGSLENIVTNPQMIFRLLKAVGIAVDGPLRTDDLENVLHGLNSYVAQPLLSLVRSMDGAGVSLSAVMQDPSKLLEALPVLMNFDLQFDVITSTFIQPKINTFWNNEDFRTKYFCNGSLPAEVFTSVGLQPGVVNTLCTIPSTQWVQTLQGLNLTQPMILAWVQKVQNAYTGVSSCRIDIDFDITVCDSYFGDLYDQKGMYWMRLMTTLESVASHLQPKDGSQGNPAEMGPSLERLWGVLKDAFLNKTVGSAMSYLELVDVMGESSEDWLAFKQAMKFLQSAGDLLNAGLHRMTDTSGTVQLQKLLPDSQQTADILQEIFGPASASEFLAASVDPKLYYQLAYPDKLKGVACDPDAFSAAFVFPAGSNVTGIQTALCSALSTRSVGVQKLIDLFQAGDMLVQLDRLISGNYSSMAGGDTGLWAALEETVSGMVSGLEQLATGRFNASVGMTWLDPVLKQLTGLSQPSTSGLEGMCQSYVAVYGGTRDFQLAQNSVVSIARMVGVFGKAAPFLTRLDEMACTVITEKGLDFAAGVEYMKQHGLMDLLHSVVELTNTTTGDVPCHELAQTFSDLYTWMNNLTQWQDPLDVDRLAQCLERGSPLFADFMQGFNEIYKVMADITGLLKDDDIRVLLQSSGELGQILEFVLPILTNEMSVTLQLEDLLRNGTGVVSYLTGILKLAPQAVESLLASSVNFNASTFLNNTVEEIADILCDPAQLEAILTLPEFSPFNISAISNYFCTAQVNITALVLKDAGKSTEIVMELTSFLANDGSTGQFVRSLTTGLMDLFSQLDSISVLTKVLDNGFDVKFLVENADSIDAIMAGQGSLQKIVDSLATIVGTLKYVVPAENQNIITDIQIFIRGLLGLDLIQSRLISAVQVSDLQTDVGAVQRYLTGDLGFSPNATEALLSSTYSIRVFLNASGLLVSDEPCQERLHQFITMNSTQGLEHEITSKFCGLNETQLTTFMEVLVPQLDIGNLIQKYVTYSGNAFLGTMNMTAMDVQIVFDSLSDGGASLQEASVILTDRNSSFAPFLANLGVGTDGEFDAMQGLQPVLCGTPGNTVGDEFNLNSRVEGPSVDSPHDEQELSQLNGDFCQDLYRTVKNTGMGAVIWSYVKPIMSGKILYTPDTPVTREIVKNANWVFDTLSEVKRVAKKWSEKVPSLVALTDTASSMQGLQDSLNSGFIKGILQSTMGVDSASLMKSLDALNSNSVNASDLRALQKVAQLVYNYTSCLDLDRFEGVASEAELESRAFELYATNKFLGGIVFLNVDDSPSGRRKRQADPTSLPPHIMYKIRMDMDNVPTTNRIKDRLWMPYNRDNFADHLRYMRGFIQLQDMVEGAILRLQTDPDTYNQTGVLMQQMPFPCHREDDYIHFLGSYLLPMLMTFAWLAAIGIATHNLVYDRQSGQEEALRIMGMRSGLNFLAWLVFTVGIMAVVAVAVTLIFKYANIFYYSNMFIVFLYLLNFCFSTTCMCYFISSFFSRATLAILTVLIMYFISFLPFVVLVAAEVHLNMWQKSLACLSSTTAFSFGAIFITRFEEEMTGIQWNKMDDHAGDSATFAWMCYMMLMDSAMYLVLGWYIRNVKPGKYGVKQPWYFPVTASYWCSCLGSSPKALPPPTNVAAHGLNQRAPEGLEVGISVRGLRKTFKGKVEVVHGINVDIFHDQVTTLLGHNGAAKTTTLNMMVGVLRPSDGVVLVDGQKSESRTGLLGICPQHNTLFEYMTVQEHMEFYGGVKGRLSRRETLAEIRKLLLDVDLLHMKDVPAMDLSGGMQRRLCVALAFVGASKTVVLDEPTSGVDPHARRNIWNLILKNRPGRTILLSTHHLDEADTLSDRILIMHTGRLLTVGSPAFLKEQLGGGYKLTVNTSPVLQLQDDQSASSSPASAVSENISSQHAKVLNFISSNMPAAKFIESVGTDLTVSLPHHGNDSASLNQFFRHLDNQSPDLGVLSYGVSNTTLEDVFLKLTSDANNEKASNNTSSIELADTDSITTTSSTDGHNDDNAGRRRPKGSVTGVSLWFQQLKALMSKRVHHYRRNWRMAFSTLVLPLLAFLCAMGFSTLRPVQDNMKDLLMTPALYTQADSNAFAFFQDNSGSNAAGHFKDMLMSSVPGIGTTCMGDYEPGDDFKCVAPGAMHASQKKEQSCRCDDYVYECSAAGQAEGVMQKMTRPGIYLQDLGILGADQYLVDSYYEYIDQRYGGLSMEPPSVSGNDSTPMAKVWFNNKGYHAIPSYFNALSNNLLRSAVSPADAAGYGITLYNHPLMLNKEQLNKETIEAGASDVGMAMVVLLSLSFIPSAFMVFLANEKLSQQSHMQSISGVSSVLYWTASYLWDMFVYSCALGVMVAVVVIFETDGFYDRENLGAFALLIFLYGWAVIPLMYCTLRLFKSGSSAYLTLFCANMLIGLITSIIIFVMTLLNKSDNIEKVSDILKYVFLVFPQFSLGMGLVELVTNQFQAKLLQRFGEDTYVSPYDMEDMLGWKFVALAVQGLVFFVLTCFIHSREDLALRSLYVQRPRRVSDSSMTSNMHYSASKDDEDVFNEQERVRSGTSEDALVVKDLCKVYHRGLKRFCAVNHLSFGVGRGECFGLLGVNGAGKTTTFKMLTGATTPSSGGAIIYNKMLSKVRSHLGDQIGYCPQEDALDMYMSGRETLRFHAQLRGFSAEDTERAVGEQLKRLELEVHADKAVHRYSGGNKRKLQLALAMLGDPPLLMLDEPTTGMDAATRRLAWKCITMAMQRGQSVLLTSHSMDECDALCSRLAIMVNGQLKCIGSPQHLKNKFGEGYTVVLHLQGLSTNRYAVAQSFVAQFPGAVIKEEHHSKVEVSIPRGAGSVADIFAAVQTAQAQHQIDYYSVSQTTLDTVFVNFARDQTDDVDTDANVEVSSSGSGSGVSSSNLRKPMIGGTYAYMNPEYAGGDTKTTGSFDTAHRSVGFTNSAYEDQEERYVTKL